MVPSSHFFSLPSPPVALPPKPAAGFAAAPRAPAGPGLLGPQGGKVPGSLSSSHMAVSRNGYWLHGNLPLDLSRFQQAVSRNWLLRIRFLHVLKLCVGITVYMLSMPSSALPTKGRGARESRLDGVSYRSSVRAQPCPERSRGNAAPLHPSS